MPTAAGPLGCEILYSLCWEDLDVARSALRLTPDSTVLAVAAAGDNVLGMLLDGPARIVAVDLNPAQTALTELKAAAIAELGPLAAEFLSGRAVANRQMYRQVRWRLSADAAQFWDGRQQAIERGVIHCGRFERFVERFRRHVLPIVPGRAVVADMLAAEDVSEQRRIYDERWNSRVWRGVVRLAFSQRVLAALGRHRAFFAYAPRMDVGTHFLRRVEAGLTQTPIRFNPYMTYALAGRHRQPDATPDFLRPENAVRIAARLDRLDIRTESVLDALRHLPAGCVDAFYLSDVFELVDHAELVSTLSEIARVGRPGARLCYWNNLVERRRPEELAEQIEPEPLLAAELGTHDRAFLYSRLVVEHVTSAVAEVWASVA